MRSDEMLMVEVAGGRFEAFEEIVRRHRGRAFGIAYHLLNDVDRAEEVAQEAFLKILRNAENYKPTASFKTFLTRVVTRLCYDLMQKRKPLNLNADRRRKTASQESSPLDRILTHERQQMIQQALDSLAPRQRVAIVLQHYERFTYEEIASTMEITEKAVERLLARARKTLKEQLSSYIDVL